MGLLPFGALGSLLALPLRVAAADRRAEEAALRSKRFVPEDPTARWDCPRCQRLNPNTTFVCGGCYFKLA